MARSECAHAGNPNRWACLGHVGQSVQCWSSLCTPGSTDAPSCESSRAAAAVSAVAMVPTVQADCRPAARPAVPSLLPMLTDPAAWRCTRRRRRGDVVRLRSPRASISQEKKL